MWMRWEWERLFKLLRVYLPFSGSPSLSPGSSTGLPSVNGTLVICPVVAVTQWVSVIDKFTSKEVLKCWFILGPTNRRVLSNHPNMVLS